MLYTSPSIQSLRPQLYYHGTTSLQRLRFLMSCLTETAMVASRPLVYLWTLLEANNRKYAGWHFVGSRLNSGYLLAAFWRVISAPALSSRVTLGLRRSLYLWTLEANNRNSAGWHWRCSAAGRSRPLLLRHRVCENWLKEREAADCSERAKEEGAKKVVGGGQHTLVV